MEVLQRLGVDGEAEHRVGRIEVERHLGRGPILERRDNDDGAGARQGREAAELASLSCAKEDGLGADGSSRQGGDDHGRGCR